MSNEVESRQLVIAIIEFLRAELRSRDSLSREDRDSLEIAIECLELAYGLQSDSSSLRPVRRSLIDVFNQAIHPPSVKNRLEAERLKNEGNQKMEEHEYEEALEAYTRAIELDKWNAIYFCNRAGANLALERHFEALTDCRQALNLNPDYAKAFGRMGQSYALLNRPRQAARCFQQALELEPDNERYRHNLTTAESQAASSPTDAGPIQNILSSLFGTPNQSPSGATLTIITEITPQNSDSSYNDSHALNENSQGNVNIENQTDQETPPSQPQAPDFLQFVLPMMLGLLGHTHSQNEGRNVGVISEEIETENSDPTQANEAFDDQSEALKSVEARNESNESEHESKTGQVYSSQTSPADVDTENTENSEFVTNRQDGSLAQNVPNKNRQTETNSINKKEKTENTESDVNNQSGACRSVEEINPNETSSANSKEPVKNSER